MRPGNAVAAYAAMKIGCGLPHARRATRFLYRQHAMQPAERTSGELPPSEARASAVDVVFMWVTSLGTSS